MPNNLLTAFILLFLSWGKIVIIPGEGQAPKGGKTIALKYYAVKDSILNEKKLLAVKYRNAKTIGEKDKIIKKAKSLFVTGISGKLFPYWYGTPWAFYGYGDTPRVNSIACGYFVATLVRDMGARVNVHDLSEGTSGDMIKKLTSKSYISRYPGLTAQAFFDEVTKGGDGLYIVGLDMHTGFLLSENGKLFFIDSAPNEVTRQQASQSYMLVNSNYRMTGKISDDPVFLRKWLNGEVFQ